MAQKFSMEYEGEWKISTPAKPAEFKNIVTPAFSPLPDNSVTFCFEAWYQEIHHAYCGGNLNLFKLKLVKLSSACISPTLEIIASVNVNYCDGSLFKDFQSLPFKKIASINEVTFMEVVTDTSASTTHENKMRGKNALIIKCKMVFYDQNLTSHFTPGIENLSSNKNLDLMRNFNPMCDPNAFSDFVIKVGDRSFPTHKVILAASSPVFKNMLTHEFLESESNCVTITDVAPDIFDLFLQFFYSGEIADKSWASLKQLYYLADKYDVEILRNNCTNAAISLLSVDLVCEILTLAYTYSDTRLKAVAINYTINHVKEIVPREDWKQLVETNSKIGYEVAVNFIPR